MAKYSSLLVFFVIVFAAAFFGSQFTPGSWYQTIQKPSWTPPSWLFGPVWTILYIAIAVAGWLVWKNSDPKLSLPIAVWALQMAFNATWSWLFFGLHRPGFALANIIVMLALILIFIKIASPKAAAWLFVPYALWVSFATALNFSIWNLNR